LAGMILLSIILILGCKIMKFNPCILGQCTESGSHCDGCGRSHVEIAETKQLISNLLEFSNRQGYENGEDFAGFINIKLLQKLKEQA